MLTWSAFALTEPELAAAGRELLYQFGVGLGFLGTVRHDGGPRLHPVCPLIAEQGLFLFLIPSPERADLLRDDRYALHSYPAPANEDAFYLTGVAKPRNEPGLRAEISAVWRRERGLDTDPPGFEDELLFELRLGTCLLTRTSGHGDYSPRHTVWHA